MSDKKVFTLSQLARSVENVIRSHCSKVIWLKAEIVKLNYYSKTGHCYPALVEKKDGKVIAEMRGNIWGSNFSRINQKFKSVLKEELKDDMTVVIQGSVTFHPVHGLALNIVDIDPEFTLGELAKEKAETIKKLKTEGIFSANKHVPLTTLPKTIAIISVDSSKGYQDFLNIITGNPWGYKYHFLLFPAILQGERAVSTIKHQLKKIKAKKDAFDAVAIIRGGGGEIGLSCFDNYQLAKEIANFPLPVLTGIGHSSNETVSELVSYESFITPTKIAEFLLQKFHDFATPLRQQEEKIKEMVKWLFRNEKSGLKETARLFNSLTLRGLENSKSRLEQKAHFLISQSNIIIGSHKHQLLQYVGQMKNNSQHLLREEANRLKATETSLRSTVNSPLEKAQRELHFTEEKLRILSPQNILKRGYSITRKNGKVITDTELLKSGEFLETQLFQGKLTSTIKEIKKPTNND